MNPGGRTDIRFWFRGRVVSVSDLPVQTTVLRWLREIERTRGTKEGCGEGDCGACTVALGSLDPTAPQGLRLRAVNSCLLLLPALDGQALFTVDDVAEGSELHPVQQALVDLHASQCGFCTPGFVMSLWADYHGRPDHTPLGRDQAREVLSGNLCRCTGYRPLVDAAVAARTYPTKDRDFSAAVAELESVTRQPALTYSSGDQTWSAPRSIEELANEAANRPEARIVAGSTDLGLQVTKGLKNLGALLSTSAVPELRTIDEKDGRLRMGAAARLTDAFAALGDRIPALADLGRWFASLSVKNAGTLGGNVMNGSPIGDSMPALLCLGAVLELRRGETVRRLPLDEFYLGYQKTARRPGEVLVAVEVPIPGVETVVRTWKVSKRREQDISAVCGAFALTRSGTTVTQARVAYGGMAAIPSRAPRTEEALTGRPFDLTTLEGARRALEQDFAPLTDGRATAAYRRLVAANLLTRLQADLAGVHP